jgi:toxin ParE1/3/4
MKIVWASQARIDFKEAIQYLREREANVALRTSRAIKQRVQLLTEQPHIGRPGRVESTRELVIPGTPYIVAYAVDSQVGVVVILRVLHSRRQWPEDLDEDDPR